MPTVFAASPALAAPTEQADEVTAFDRDVFEIVGSTLRNPDVDTDPAAPLFTNSAVGLEFTGGQWSSATATSAARRKGGPKEATTTFDLDFAGLVPNGLYTVLWGTLIPDSEQPLCPGVERTLPLDSDDPTSPSPRTPSSPAPTARPDSRDRPEATSSRRCRSSRPSSTGSPARRPAPSPTGASC